MAVSDSHSLRDEYTGDVEELTLKLSTWASEWDQLRGDQHAAMEVSHDFYHGTQMPEKDRAALEEAGRPIITVNKIAPAVDAMYGAIIHNALGFSYVSPHPTDKPGVLQPRPDELMDGAASFVRRKYGADGKDRLAILDMMIGGIGCQEMRTDSQLTNDIEVVVDHIDPFSVGWDTRAKESGLIDRRWDFTRRYLSEDEFETEFGIKPEDIDPPAEGGESSSTVDDPASRADDPYEVRRWQWYEHETYHVYVVATGQIGPDGYPVTENVPANAEEADAIDETMVIAKSKPRKRRVYWEALTSGSSAIIEVYRVGVNKFTRCFITGKRDRSSGVWYGIVRHAESPQQWANAFFSSVIYIIASGPKGYAIERGALVDKDQAQREWAMPDKLKVLEDGAISNNRLMELKGNQLPSGLADMAMLSIGFVPEVLGASLELRGMQANNQSGVTEGARADASIGVIGWIFAELREFYRRHGELLLDFMTQYIEPGRLILMSTGDGDQYRQFQPPGKDVHYDVVVDEVPSSPNKRRAVFNALAQLVPFFQLDPTQIPPGTGIELLRSSPLPGDVVRRLEQNAAQPNPQAEQMKQLQMRDQVATVMEKEARGKELETQALLNMAKARETGQDAEIAQRIAATDIQKKVVEGNVDIAIKERKAVLDHHADMTKIEIDRVRQEQALKAQLAQQSIRMQEQKQKKDSSSK